MLIVQSHLQLFLSQRNNIKNDQHLQGRTPDTSNDASAVVLWSRLRFLSYDVLVDVSLAVVRRHEGIQPADGERVAEHHLHIHPLRLLGPSSLLLLELLNAL